MVARIARRWHDWMQGSAGRGLSSLGLLVLRVCAGSLLIALHGWPKLSTFSETAAHFPDPLGAGSSLSLALVVGAEFFCSLLIVLGLLTRLAVVPLIVSMSVAAFVFHGDDPWAKKELALLYLTPFVTLLMCGAGRVSLDALIGRWLRNRPQSSE